MPDKVLKTARQWPFRTTFFSIGAVQINLLPDKVLKTARQGPFRSTFYSTCAVQINFLPDKVLKTDRRGPCNPLDRGRSDQLSARKWSYRST